MRRTPLLPWLLVFPTALGIGVFTLYPLVATTYRSLFKQNQAVRVPAWIGLGNYKEIATDDTFHEVFRNTVLFIVGTVPASIVLALLFAIFLNRKLKGIGILRSAFFYPTVLPMVSAAAIWLFLYTPHCALLTQTLPPSGPRPP